MNEPNVFETIKSEFENLGVLEEYSGYFTGLKAEDSNVVALNAYRIVRYAARVGLWDIAEKAYEDPRLMYTIYCEDKEDAYYSLGTDAIEVDDFDRARAYIGRIKSGIDADAMITERLISTGRLEEAIDEVRKVEFKSIKEGLAQRNLGNLTFALSKQVDGPKKALSLVKDLVPIPEHRDRYAESRIEYFLGHVAPAALAQQDFDTAEEVVELLGDWYVGPASGGGGLLEYAYEQEDDNVLASTWALILRKWGNGRAIEDLPDMVENLDSEVKKKIGEWLTDTKAKYEAGLYNWNHPETFPDNLTNLITLYSQE